MTRLAEYRASFQPYYVAYAAAHGVTPETMAARTDRLRNVDFMVWMRRQWQAFRAVRPDLFAPRPYDNEPQRLPGCHEAFGAWLAGGAA